MGFSKHSLPRSEQSMDPVASADLAAADAAAAKTAAQQPNPELIAEHMPQQFVII